MDQSINFSNLQQFVIDAMQYQQNIQQKTTVYSKVTVRKGSTVQQEAKTFTYPLTLNYYDLVHPDNSQSVTTTISQACEVTDKNFLNGYTLSTSTLLDEVMPTDTLLFDSSGNFAGNTGQKSSQIYSCADTQGNHYFRALTAANGVLTGVVSGKNSWGN